MAEWWGPTMDEYRVYLRDGMGFIRARQDFTAAGLTEAIEISSFLFDACSDECRSYELWSGTVLIGQNLTSSPPVRLELLNEARQNHVIELEETLHQSKWAITKSARLHQALESVRSNRRSKMANR